MLQFLGVQHEELPVSFAEYSQVQMGLLGSEDAKHLQKWPMLLQLAHPSMEELKVSNCLLQSLVLIKMDDTGLMPN